MAWLGRVAVGSPGVVWLWPTERQPTFLVVLFRTSVVSQAGKLSSTLRAAATLFLAFIFMLATWNMPKPPTPLDRLLSAGVPPKGPGVSPAPSLPAACPFSSDLRLIFES